MAFKGAAGLLVATVVSIIGHHLGLMSTLQVAHVLSVSRTESGVLTGESSTLTNAKEARLFVVGVDIGAPVDVRRFWDIGILTELAVLVDWLTRFALRTVPVSAKSACLKFCT